MFKLCEYIAQCVYMYMYECVCMYTRLQYKIIFYLVMFKKFFLRNIKLKNGVSLQKTLKISISTQTLDRKKKEMGGP